MTYIQEVDAGVGAGGGWSLHEEIDASSGTTLSNSTNIPSDTIGIKAVCHNLSHDGGVGVYEKLEVTFTPTATFTGQTVNVGFDNVVVWGTQGAIPSLDNSNSFAPAQILEMWRWVDGSTHYWTVQQMVANTAGSSPAEIIGAGAGQISLASVLTNINFRWEDGDDFDRGVIRIYTQ